MQMSSNGKQVLALSVRVWGGGSAVCRVGEHAAPGP